MTELSCIAWIVYATQDSTGMLSIWCWEVVVHIINTPSQTFLVEGSGSNGCENHPRDWEREFSEALVSAANSSPHTWTCLILHIHEDD